MTPVTDLIDRLEYVAMPDQFGAVGPHAHLCREAAAALRALEARVRELEAEKLSPPQTYPQWGLTGNGDPVRIDHDGCVWFGTGMRVLPGSRWVGTFCSREQAVARLAEILKDQTVAAEGFKARVCYNPASRWWQWDVFDGPTGTRSTTEPVARKALTEWLLDNCMREDKR
jgi:hypothetical protein